MKMHYKKPDHRVRMQGSLMWPKKPFKYDPDSPMGRYKAKKKAMKAARASLCK